MEWIVFLVVLGAGAWWWKGRHDRSGSGSGRHDGSNGDLK